MGLEKAAVMVSALRQALSGWIRLLVQESQAKQVLPGRRRQTETGTKTSGGSASWGKRRTGTKCTKGSWLTSESMEIPGKHGSRRRAGARKERSAKDGLTLHLSTDSKTKKAELDDACKDCGITIKYNDHADNGKHHKSWRGE